MYHHLRGMLLELSPTAAVLEVGGVGFDLRIPVSTYELLKGKKEAHLLTHLHVREDDLRLFGFATSGERELFRLFLSVNGVGTAIALASLSALGPAEAASALAHGDLKTLQEIKGVGRKLAERMALELRDRVGPLLSQFGLAQARDGERAADSSRLELHKQPTVADAIHALVSLGFDRKGAEGRVEGALRKLKVPAGAPVAVSVEQLIKEALRGS